MWLTINFHSIGSIKLFMTYELTKLDKSIETEVQRKYLSSFSRARRTKKYCPYSMSWAAERKGVK